MIMWTLITLGIVLLQQKNGQTKIANAQHSRRSARIDLQHTTTPPPLAILVEVDVEPTRLDAFRAAMEIDVQGSRKEPGCLRFDLLQDQSDPCKFFFYEVYKDADAVSYHKQTEHFAAWAAFKESGGVLSQRSSKCDAVDYI